MNENIDSALIAELKRLRSGAIDLPSFQRWLSEDQQKLGQSVSSGILLKLKRGDERQAMKAAETLLPTCVKCRDICKHGGFLTRQEYALCASQVARAVENSTLTAIARPRWFYSDDKHYGADGYFKCNTCDAFWTLVAPEREDNGLWERIA
jgi:hypothetical protein